MTRDDTARAMYASYLDGHTLAEVAAEFGRSNKQSVWNLFRRRGWPLRDRTGRATATRLPWAPFARYLPAQIQDIADLFGVDPRTVHRYERDGVPADLADRFAVAAGTHVAVVWGDAYYQAFNDQPTGDKWETAA